MRMYKHKKSYFRRPENQPKGKRQLMIEKWGIPGDMYHERLEQLLTLCKCDMPGEFFLKAIISEIIYGSVPIYAHKGTVDMVYRKLIRYSN